MKVLLVNLLYQLIVWVFYFLVKVNKKYKNLGKNLLLVRLEKQGRDYGIAIAGHKDRKKMSTFICGLNPKGAAIKTGQFQVGDEIIEVNKVLIFQLYYEFSKVNHY